MKHSALKLFLFVAALFAAWTAFSGARAAGKTVTISDGINGEPMFVEVEADLGKYSETFARWKISKQFPPRFQKVLVLFSADTTKEDRDAFLAGLEEVRLRHLKDYHEIVRKWWEIRETESEKEYDGGTGEYRNPAAWERFTMEQEFERDFYHNPYFLKLVDVRMIRTEKGLAYYDRSSYPAPFRPSDLDSLNWNLATKHLRKGVAVIVAASDEIAAEVTRKIREETEFLPVSDDTVVLFAGVSSFDESVREPQESDDGAIEPAKAPYAFAIKYSADPWPNTDLALSVFPKTKKVILLAPEKLWNEEKETAFKAKLGPGKTLKTIPMSEVDEGGRSDADLATIRNMFAASVKAEIQPDTVIVSMSCVESGQDPVSWLPEKFDACPIFADTKPVYPSSVGGFCRSMENLGVQAAELLEQLGGDSLDHNKLPPSVLEDDALWLNEAALKRYGLKASAFPDSAILMNTKSNQAPRVRVYQTWSKKRICLLLAANAAVLFGGFLFALVTIRAIRRKRKVSEAVYDSLPVRILVMDRDGRFLEYHKQYGEVEQKGDFPWENIADVPWLQGLGVLDIVHEAFDSGKTVVRELEIDGERRVVVLSCTTSEIFGRPAVIAVSSDSPGRQTPPQQ